MFMTSNKITVVNKKTYMKEYYSTRNFNDETLNKIFSTLKLWTEFIQNTINFSFIKFGDGEFYCMMGQ